MPPVIFCYSRSGHTRHAADVLSQKTGASVVPLEVDRYSLPLLWVLRAIWDVAQARTPPLRTSVVASLPRPWVVVAGPVWASGPSAPMRSALQQLSRGTEPVGVLTTSGNPAEPVKCLRACAAVLGRGLVGHANIENRIEGTGMMDARLTALAADMAMSASVGAA